jgi:phage shock protein PspC (stress-responsive transcriptional regulator)
MDKTININLGGSLFQVDDEAYRILKDYLQAINNRFRGVQGAAETIEDIESRIAEIFLSQRGIGGVITKENVEAMISIIGRPEDFDNDGEEQASPVYTNVRKRMYRNPDDQIVSGVCGGLGAYLNTDPVIFRILFVLFTFSFGIGFFIYLALWISLPPASNDTRKREMYGDAYNSAISRERRSTGASSIGNTSYNSSYYNRSGVSNAFNEIFGAVGRVCFIIFRIFMIVFGIFFVLTGFLFILSFVMIFVFKYPGAFSTDAFDFNFVYFPDFLNYIVNPSVAPWIIALATLAFILPMLALIYWGVKMIFWFKAKDGIYSLAALVLWVMSVAALSLVLFNEGISFAQAGRTVSEAEVYKVPSTLYIKANKKLSNLEYDRDLAIKDEDYIVYINENKKELYITPYLNINNSGSQSASMNITRRSSGRSDIDARKRADELEFTYRMIGDTLFLDEYFMIPSGRKWSADNVGINLYVPSGTKIKLDSGSEKLLHKRSDDRDWDLNPGRQSTGINLLMTEEGAEPVEEDSPPLK